ncbi:MAG: hypothetical protein GZ088_02170 [Acidipila sp.]|nr:hypothetical protein [Acidipila sp.]
MSARSSGGAREEEFRHLLHFSNLQETEACLRRLDDLWRGFRAEEQRAHAERILEVARLGLQRAKMIAGNKRVSAARRAEKEEIRQWFRVWLENPEVFFDWLEVRKQTPDFLEKFAMPAVPENHAGNDEG